MAATYMLRKHLRSMALADRPEACAERKRHIDACALAKADRIAKFPIITKDNFEAASNYQNERIAFYQSRSH